MSFSQTQFLWFTLGGLLVLGLLITSIYFYSRVQVYKKAWLASSQEEKRLADNLEGLLQISEVTAHPQSAEDIFGDTLETVSRVTGFQRAAIYLFDPDKEMYFVVAHRGWTPEMIQESSIFSIRSPLVGPMETIRATHKAVAVDDIHNSEFYMHKTSQEAGFKSLIEVPLLAGDTFLGVFTIGTKKKHCCDEQELRWLEAVGRQIGVTVYNLRAVSQERYLAILQERERLSQEIHDSLSQMVGTLQLRAQKAQTRLEAGDLSDARSEIDEIYSLSVDAYRIVREEILGLRDTISEGQDLASVLGEHLERFERQWKIKTVLDWDAGSEDLSMAPQVEIQLLRIVQESMTNVHRHSNAANLYLRLKADPGTLHVTIEDDGQGFEAGQVSQERIGLRVMQERAAAVKGKVTIDSTPGKGTCVQVDLPRFPELKIDGAQPIL